MRINYLLKFKTTYSIGYIANLRGKILYISIFGMWKAMPKHLIKTL